MELLLRLMLIALYVLWLPGMLLRRALGGDPLQLKKPGGSSYWLIRKSHGSRESYFSEDSQSEGRMTQREGNESGSMVGRNKPPLFARLLKCCALPVFAAGQSTTRPSGARK